MSLFETFLALPPPTAAGAFSAERDTGQRCRVARSHDGHPCLLIRFATDSSTSTGRTLATLSYRPPSLLSLVAADGTQKTAYLSILECKAVDPDVARYFYRVMDSVVIADERTADEPAFERALDAIVNLFRALQKPAKKSVQGLWAELALIAWSADPVAAISAWHSDPAALHDFSAGAFRVEVKSTMKSLREHSVGLDQLSAMSPGRTLLVSFQLHESGEGESVEDLLGHIRSRLTAAGDSRARLEIIAGESLGQDWKDANDVRFDPRHARERLRAYWGDQVPSVTQPVPPEVKAVQFVVDLSSTPNTDLDEARAAAPLFAALLPMGSASDR